jgi:hypothetical protein
MKGNTLAIRPPMARVFVLKNLFGFRWAGQRLALLGSEGRVPILDGTCRPRPSAWPSLSFAGPRARGAILSLRLRFPLPPLHRVHPNQRAEGP